MLRDSDEAEDVVQETFVRLYRARPRYEEQQRFESWLFQILGNCCRTANTAHRRESSRRVSDVSAVENVASNEDPSRAAERHWSTTVREALAELPEHNREVFLLHYVEDFSYEEIERMTGVRQSALKMRVKRASDALRSRLASWAERR